MGRSIEAIQDATLGNFKKTMRQGNSESISTRSIERAKKAKVIHMNNLKKKDDGTKTVYGVSVTMMEETKKKIEDKKNFERKRLLDLKNSRNRHSFLNEVLDIFKDLDIDDFTPENLEQFHKTSYTLLDTEKLKITLKLDKCLKTNFRFYILTEETVPHFEKAEDYDVTKNIVESTKVKEEKTNHKAGFGMLEFRKGLLKPFTELIKKFNIEDKNAEAKEDIWTFEF